MWLPLVLKHWGQSCLTSIRLGDLLGTCRLLVLGMLLVLVLLSMWLLLLLLLLGACMLLLFGLLLFMRQIWQRVSLGLFEGVATHI